MFHLINTKTNEVAFVGATPTECKAYAIKKRIFIVDRSKYFKHIICGVWDIKRVK